MFPTPQKGQLVHNPHTGESGIVVSVFYNEFSDQSVVTVRVPGVRLNPMWNEGRVVPAATADALASGDMVIAFAHDGTRHMGTVVGKTADGHLMAAFAIGTFKVDMDRVWRAWPVQTLAAVAS